MTKVREKLGHAVELARDIWDSFKKRGAFATLALFPSELMFDIRYGTQTREVVRKEDLRDVSSPNLGVGTCYWPANPRLFQQTLRKLREQLGRDFSRDTFVDFGCGKGRALLMAAREGFGQAIGVDYSAELCEISKKNIAPFTARTKVTTRFEVIHADVANWPIPEEATVFFLFNPFGGRVLAIVLQKIGDFAKNNRRAAPIVYLNPVHPEAFSKDKFRIIRDGRPDALVYEPTME